MKIKFLTRTSKKSQRGQGMSEYLIMVGVIAVASLAVFGFFGSTVESQISGMAQELSGSSGTDAQSNAQSSASSAQSMASSERNSLSNYTSQN